MSKARKKRRHQGGQEPSLPLVMVDEPAERDVILTRGSAHAWRPGNSAFHRLLDQHAPNYHDKSTTKKQKSQLIQSIYHQITLQMGGRFLMPLNNNPDRFVLVSENEAHAKISDAIRYRLRRQQQQQEQQKQNITAAYDSTLGFGAADLSAVAIPLSGARCQQEETQILYQPQSQIELGQTNPFPLNDHSLAELSQAAAAAARAAEESSDVEIFSDQDLSSVLDFDSDVKPAAK